MDRKVLNITVLNEQTDEEWTVPEFLDLIAKAAAEIPPEYRSQAKVSLDEHGDGWGELSIEYDRPETDAEASERIAKESAEDAHRAAYWAQQRYNLYMLLKAQFEPTSAPTSEAESDFRPLSDPQ